MNKPIVQFAIVFVIFIGCTVFLGWWLDIPLLKNGLLSSLYTMKPTTAACFVLVGISLELLQQPHFPQWVCHLAQGCAFLTAIIGLVTLSQSFFEWNISGDGFVLTDNISLADIFSSKQMGIVTAFDFVLVSIAVLLLAQKNQQRYCLAQSLSFVVVLMTTAILLNFSGFATYTDLITPYTAVTFIILCIGLLLAHPNQGLMKIVTSSSIGGASARRLLPWAIIFPPVINWLTQHEIEVGYIHLFVHVFQTAITMFAFSMLICWNAQTVDQIETHRQRTAQRLWEAQQQFRRAVMESPLPIMIHAEDGEVVQINHVWTDITGYKPEDIPTIDRWTELAYGKRQESVREMIDYLYNLDTRVANGEFTIRTRNGDKRIWDFYSAPLGKDSNDRRLVLSTAIDVTQRKQAETSLKQINASLEMRVKERTSELEKMNQLLQNELFQHQQTQLELRSVSERLKYIVSVSPAVIYTCKAEGDFGATFISENVTAVLGYRPQDFVDNSDFWIKHIHPEDANRILAGAPHLRNKSHHSHQYRFLCADGKYRWLHSQVNLARDEEGHDIEVIGYLVDITELKTLEMELTQKQQFLNSFISCAPVGIAILDNQMQYTLVNEALAEINGVSVQEHIGKKPWDIGISVASDIEEINQQVLTTGQPLLNVEMTGETRKLPRVLRTWLVSHFPISDQTHQPTSAGVIVAEITEQKQAKLALQEREAMLKAIGDNLPNGAIYQVTPDLNHNNGFWFYYISAGIENLFEVTAEDALKNPNLLLNQCLEEDHLKMLQAAEESQRNMSVVDIQLRIKTPSGYLKWLHFRSTPRLLDDGRIIWEGLVVDITEIKQAEETLRLQAQKEQSLNRVIQAIRNSLDLQTIFNTTTTEIAKLVQADRASIVQYLPNQKLWKNLAEYRQTSDISSVLGLEITDEGNDFTARLKQLQVVRIDNVGAIEDDINRKLYQEHSGAWLLIPLHINSTVWGSLNLVRCNQHSTWQESEVELTKTVADQLMIAIQQSKLYQQAYEANQELHRLATHDELTQIANRRYFDDYLKQQWLHHTRAQAPLSLILSDVDYFKRYNDTYGHLSGDTCLVKIAQAIKHAVTRSTDLVARYGGEEFAVILPNTDTQGAVQVVQSIQQEVRQLNIPHSATTIGYITLSFGIATTFPTHNTSEKTLIEVADWALYEAKKERNSYHTICIEK